MALNKVKIGSFVELYHEVCNIPHLTVYDVSGVNRDKEFFEPSKQVGSDTSKYKVVPPGYFACNLMHVGRDVVLPIAINHTNTNRHVSPAYTVFGITDETVILKEYFYILLNSKERDRYFWFHTDSSVRDGMEWNVFCDMELEIPSLETQRKYAALYLGMEENLDALTRSIEQMQSACDAYMEHLLKRVPREPVGKYIAEVDERNRDEQYGLDHLRGISIEKRFIGTKANMQGVSLKPYKIIEPETFCYVTVTSRNGGKVSIAFNESADTHIVSSSYVSFRIVNSGLQPQYLFMFLKGPEFDRFARFHSWGSARETFALDDLGRFEIPVPSEEIQKDIVNIFHVMNERKQLRERLVELQKNICPILIKGAVEEGGRI
ncbi:restriction endonuclease subunit S [Lachnospiraceae bacterium 62-35]